ncbi:MAG: hypothetical protein D6717_03545 [Gammaproteobacteria bacterium]|nr:MAG: hypothetical protein D6717_03545 [Gammaproteobacteria bacterium]
MVLKPQDVFIALKLVALGRRNWTYAALSQSLHMSASEINAGVKRGIRARLLTPPQKRGDNPRPILMALEEFLVHGVKYAFPPDRGALTMGVATGHAGPHGMGETWQVEEIPPVWPHPHGKQRGYAFSPLYPSVPEAASEDPRLYQLLALTDILRDEQARERNQAARQLSLAMREAISST